MRKWLVKLASLLLAAYFAVANYNDGDLGKIIVAGVALMLIDHIVIGVWRGLLWIIVADLNEKLRKD
jgi:hypothetical protein